MGGFACFLGVGEELFVELFARAQAGELDADLIFAVARKTNHVARQIDDLHRLAHVEHKNLAALPHRGRLQHQLRRLGDGHEIAVDLGVGHRDRSAARDLLGELGNHTAGAAQHIAKAHHFHLRAAVAGAVQCLARHLGKALGGAHHVGGVHRLVGGDENEAFGAMLLRRRRHPQGAEHIVARGLPGVGHFHQRHMLVSGGVEDQLRLPAEEDFLDAQRVLDVTCKGDDLDIRSMDAEPLFDGVEREFAGLEQQQARGGEARELATQLAADGAASTGDEHGFASDHALEVRRVDLHRVAPEQVLDLDRAHGVDGNMAVHQVFEAGDG